MCVFVSLGSGFGPSQIPSVLFVTAQRRAGAAVSGLHHGRRGVARYQLYLRGVGPCRTHVGCRAPESVSGALVA